MLVSKNLYNDYINSINYRISVTAEKIENYKKTIEYCKDVISANSIEFEKAGVSIDNLFSNAPIAYIKIKPLVEFGYLSNVEQYVKSYANATKYLNLHNKILERLLKCIIPYETYRRILYEANEQIAKYILNGGVYTFGNLGSIYIIEKPRVFFDRDGEPVCGNVNWDLSFKYKQHIIDKGLIPYSASYAPNGVKWLQFYDDDLVYWFKWSKLFFKNKGLFKFVPSKYVRRGERKKIGWSSKEEILNSREIGNIQKMWYLMNFDKDHHLLYKKKRNIEKKDYIKELETV